MKKIFNVAQLYRDNEIRLLTEFNIFSSLFHRIENVIDEKEKLVVVSWRIWMEIWWLTENLNIKNFKNIKKLNYLQNTDKILNKNLKNEKKM